MNNLLWRCLIFGVCELAITVILLNKNKKKYQRAVQLLLIGVVVIITTLIYPMYRNSYKFGTSLLFSILYALRALAGCQSVDLSHKVEMDGMLYFLYYALLYASFIAAPLFTTGFLVSVFGNMMDNLRFMFVRKDTICVFSELNDGSVCLAESIYKKDSKKKILFLNYDLKASDKDTNIIKRIRNIKGIILNKNELDVMLFTNNIEFYEVYKNTDKNADNTILLVEKYKEVIENSKRRSEASNNKKPVKKVNITSFTKGVTIETLLDSTEKGDVRVDLIDEVKYGCYSLLDKKPLFENIRNGKMSVLLVGCGDTGYEMLKAVYWCGQLSGCELEINVIDTRGSWIKDQFILECPGINLEEENIRFIQADARTAAFREALDVYCKKTTYAIVAMTSDVQNISTSMYLRTYFLQLRETGFSNLPVICLRVRDSGRLRQVQKLVNNRNEEFNFHPFGSLDDTYSVDVLIGKQLEKMALNTHLTYYGVLGKDAEADDYKNAVTKYYSSEYNQRSSLASALHIKYKMFCAGVPGICGNDITAEQADMYENLIQDETMKEKMSILEHDRWMAFFKTEGYQKADIKDVKVYYNALKKPSHVHHLAKLHPTMVPWDELDEVSEELSVLENKKLDFKDIDTMIICALPNIVKASI